MNLPSQDNMTSDHIWYKADINHSNEYDEHVKLSIIFEDAPGEMMLGNALDIHFGDVKACKPFGLDNDEARCVIVEFNDDKCTAYCEIHFYRDNITSLDVVAKKCLAFAKFLGSPLVGIQLEFSNQIKGTPNAGIMVDRSFVEDLACGKVKLDWITINESDKEK